MRARCSTACLTWHIRILHVRQRGGLSGVVVVTIVISRIRDRARPVTESLQIRHAGKWLPKPDDGRRETAPLPQVALLPGAADPSVCHLDGNGLRSRGAETERRMINTVRTGAPILMLAVVAALAGCHSGTAASSVQSAQANPTDTPDTTKAKTHTDT